MTTEIVLRQQSYSPQTFEDIERLGKAMAQSGFFKDTRDAGQAVVKILAGQELGVPPVAAMRGLHVVEGKIELSGTLIAALIKRSGRYDYRVVESNEQRCVIEFKQETRGTAGWDDIGSTVWTIENAANAGLCRIEDGKAVARSREGKKKPWETYTRAMLFNRAMAEGARMHTPDIFDGPIYSEGEIREAVELEGEVIDIDPALIPSGGGSAVSLPDDSVPTEVVPAEPSPDPTPENVADGEAPGAEGPDEAPPDDAETTDASSSGDPIAELEQLKEQLGWTDGRVLKLARKDLALSHIVKWNPATLSPGDAEAIVAAMRAEVAKVAKVAK